MRLRLLVLLAGTRLRLAPRWLRAQPRCRPVHMMITAILLLAVLLALLLPSPARACRHAVSKVPARVRLICTDAPPGAR